MTWESRVEAIWERLMTSPIGSQEEREAEAELKLMHGVAVANMSAAVDSIDMVTQ